MAEIPLKFESPEALLGALLEAASSDDPDLLLERCRVNQDAVQENFPDWRRVPEEIRADPEAVHRYVQGLVAVARVFAERLGRLELLQLLAPSSPEEGPYAEVERGIRQAREHIEALDLEAARELLDRTLESLDGTQGSHVRFYTAVAHGARGESWFHQGRVPEAVADLETALQICWEERDEEGMLAYLGSLFEVHRWDGNAELAERAGEQLARVHEARGRPAEAERTRDRVSRVRSGEPLCRVVFTVGEEKVEADRLDLSACEGRVPWEFVRNRLTLRPAMVLCEQGKAAAEAGDLAAAEELFRAASERDHHSPDPWYQLGTCLMDQGRAREAADAYRRTEELAPGWYQCRADAWMAERIADGRLPESAYQLHRALDDPGHPLEHREAVARELIDRHPEVAEFRLTLAEALLARGAREEAEQALRAGLAGEGEAQIRTRLLLRLGNELEDGEERRRLLGEACELRGDLASSALAAAELRRRAD